MFVKNYSTLSKHFIKFTFFLKMNQLKQNADIAARKIAGSTSRLGQYDIEFWAVQNFLLPSVAMTFFTARF